MELLKKCNCPIYKVASPEIEDLRLIEQIAKLKKPIIISTGIADEKNIKNALDICIKHKNYNVILLNCISSYPAKNSELNLKYLNVLKSYISTKLIYNYTKFMQLLKVQMRKQLLALELKKTVRQQ